MRTSHKRTYYVRLEVECKDEGDHRDLAQFGLLLEQLMLDAGYDFAMATVTDYPYLFDYFEEG